MPTHYPFRIYSKIKGADLVTPSEMASKDPPLPLVNPGTSIGGVRIKNGMAHYTTPARVFSSFLRLTMLGLMNLICLRASNLI